MSTKPTRTKKYILAVDVGNTSTSFGVYLGGRRLKVDRLKTDELGVRRIGSLVKAWHDRYPFTGAAFASVVPGVNAALHKSISRVIHQPVLEVHHTLELGVPVSYPHPDRIGPDRLANSAGAVRRYQAPLIVVDIGTATTFDVILPGKGGYTGGAIAPGPSLMLEYLADKTALLPRITLRPVRRPTGKSTVEAMRIGALHGYRGMIREILRHLMQDMDSEQVTVVATGGYARWVLDGLDQPFIYDNDLTLYGIACIYELNR